MLDEDGREEQTRTTQRAVRWIGAALHLPPAAGPGGRRVEILLAFAGALAACGRFSEARGAVLEGLALSPREAVAQRVELIVAGSTFDTLLGEHARAQERLEAA